MMLDLSSFWMLCGLLHLVIIGATVVYSPTLKLHYSPHPGGRPHFYNNHYHHYYHHNSRSGRSSSASTSSSSSSSSTSTSTSTSSNGNGFPITRWRQLEANLSGSSSSPVEPIKPLLDLSSGNLDEGMTIPSQPVFDAAAPKNVSALSGQSAYLHCLVHNLANKSVSWIRQRDLHILTVGRYTYTTDQRYQVIHSRGSKDWILKIKYAQERDSGNYECQISTKPIRSYTIYLNVFTAATAEIIGAPDMHLDMGSTINLTCIISHSAESPDYIVWYHNKKELNYDSPRGGITVLTERGKTTTGYLLIQNAQPSDTGNYSCAPSNTKPTTLRVHVLNGETPAAMQTNITTSIVPVPFCQILLLAMLIWCITSHSSPHSGGGGSGAYKDRGRGT